MPDRAPTHEARLKQRREATARRSDARMRTNAQRIRSSARWQKVRLVQLRNHPLCQPCLSNGITEGGSARKPLHVHHIQPVEQRPDRAFDLTNLQTICTSCHAQENVRERRGR